MKNLFASHRTFKVLTTLVIGVSCNQVIAQDLLCRGQVTYTYPDGKQSYAQYYLQSRQRYPGDCFLNFCPAKCPFETAARPKKHKVMDSDAHEKKGPKKQASSN